MKAIVLLSLLVVTSVWRVGAETRLSITETGAVGDGTTLNTEKIQAAIDRLAANGGGTVVIPQGVFLSGAIFLKPGVNLRLKKDAVLKCSTDMKNFPEQRTWIEGHYEAHFTPALINASGCNGVHITGEGTLDGAGRPIWDQFWKSIQADKNFKNLDLPRARLVIVDHSKGAVIDGITFKDSQYWNLHLYHCQKALVRNARFLVPDDYKQAPSTDGIDVDSSQDVTIDGCYFSVTDDCIAVKGAKGPDAQKNEDSPPVEHIHVTGCTFKRGNAAVTLGSEAGIVRDVLTENSTVIGSLPVLNCKLRPDTPQIYENLKVRNVTVDNAGGGVLKIAPWTQYFDLKGQPPPRSSVRNIVISGIKGQTKFLASIKANPGQTAISDITLENIDVQLKSDQLETSDVKNLKIENVKVNGKPLLIKDAGLSPTDKTGT